MPLKTDTLKSFKVLFGAGKAPFVILLALMVLSMPLVRLLELPLYVTLPILFLALLLPIFYVPLVYNLINNSPIVVFGRYHLPLFFSSLIGSIFVAILFNISPNASLGVKTTMFLLCALFIIFSIFVYSYVYSAINVRINEGYKKLFASAQNTFLFFATIAFSLCFLYFYNDGVSLALGVIGYVTASIMLIGGFLAYLASYRLIPKLVRVTLNPKRSIKDSFLKFYSLLVVTENHRTLISFFLFCVASSLPILTMFDVFKLFGLSTLLITLTLLCFGFCYCIAISVFSRKIYIGSYFLSALGFAVMVSLLVPRTFIDFSSFNNVAVLLAYSSVGLCIGLIQNGYASDFSLVSKRSNASVGTVLNIKNTLASISFFVAICVYSLLSLIKIYGFIINLSVSVCFIVAAFCVKFVKKRYLTLEFPTENEQASEKDDKNDSEPIDDNA